MLWLGLLGCNPLADVVEREAPWWGPTDQLAAQTGVELVPLPAGEPVGYWPRIVIGTDRVELDNRAWFLSLPGEVHQRERADDRPALVEGGSRIAVVNGEILHAEVRGQRIDTLYQGLLEMAESHQSMARQGPRSLEFRGEILIVPARGTSAKTLSQVIYTAAQASYGSAGIAGSVDGRLRMAAASAPGTCLAQIPLAQRGRGLHLGEIGPDRCPVAPEAFPGHLRQLSGTCLDRLDATIADAFAGRRVTPPPEVAESRCIQLHTWFLEGRVDVVLPALAAVHPLFPEVRPGFLVRGADHPETTTCEPAPPLASQSDAELDSLCRMDLARDRLERGIANLEEGVPWGRRRMNWRREVDPAEIEEVRKVVEALDGIFEEPPSR